MAKDELDEIASARREYDTARRKLMAKIRIGLEAGHGPSAVGRAARWTREYIAKIRDGKVKDS